MPPSAGYSDQETPDRRGSAPLGPRILITAGPTHEPIDEVRFIGNRSSGRMGLAIAEASLQAGCPTTVLLGPVCQPTTDLMDIHRFRTSLDLRSLIKEQWPAHDILIMAAAVSDFMPTNSTMGKGPRRQGPVSMELTPTPDLLEEAASDSLPTQTLIGFALEEASNLEEKARRKLEKKGVHAIVANPLETMDANMIRGFMVIHDGTIRDPGASMTKPEFGSWLIEQALDLHQGK